MPVPAEVAIVIADLQRGGAQKVATLLANRWAADGRAVALITLDDGSSDAFGLAPDVVRRSLSLRGDSGSPVQALLGNLARLRALRRAIRDSGAATVFSFVGATNVLTALAGLGLPCRIVLCERNDPARQSLGRPWDWLRRRCYRLADRVTANSHGALASLGAFVPETKLAFVANPLIAPASVKPIALPAPTILAVGRLHRQKGFDILLQAFAGSTARRHGWRLAILGDGDLRDALLTDAQTLGIAEAVDWPGAVPDPFPYLAAAQIFALPSRYEGMPNALLEAMAMGLPAVVSDAAVGAGELIDHDRSGLVVPNEDPQALATALDRLAEDPALRGRLGAAAEARSQAFRPEAAFRDWDRLLVE